MHQITMMLQKYIDLQEYDWRPDLCLSKKGRLYVDQGLSHAVLEP